MISEASVGTVGGGYPSLDIGLWKTETWLAKAFGHASACFLQSSAFYGFLTSPPMNFKSLGH